MTITNTLTIYSYINRPLNSKNIKNKMKKNKKRVNSVFSRNIK